MGVSAVTRQCKDCGLVKPLTDFVSREPARRGHYSYCRPCYNARGRAYASKKREHNRKRNVDYRRRLRQEVITGYGGKCACCGESRNEFLALDHINGGGSKERRTIASNTPSGIYRIAKRLGFPTDRYRLLCHNCNSSIGWYGYCPHQREAA